MHVKCATCQTLHDLEGLQQLRSIMCPNWEEQLAERGWIFAGGLYMCILVCPKCDEQGSSNAAQRRNFVANIARTANNPREAAMFMLGIAGQVVGLREGAKSDLAAVEQRGRAALQPEGCDEATVPEDGENVN